MGKAVKAILGAALIVASFVVPPVAFGFAFLPAATFVSLSTILQAVGAISLSLALTPELDLSVSRTLAENLHVQTNPLAIRSVPLGKTAVAGQVLFRKNIRNSGETPDEILIILGLAGFPSTSLTKFWFNGELVFSGESTTGPGAITSGKFANDLWVWFRTGEELTAAFPDIATLSPEWAAKSRILRGIPSVGIRLKVTEKVEGRFEPLAEFKGVKMYDPRLDSTIPGGSGTHRFTDPATWAWSENPKLAEILYIRGAEINGVRIFGMGKPADAIDLEHMASEANICEEQIPVLGGGSINRYTCNGLLIPSSNHRRNLKLLMSASASTGDASTGIYRTFAGAWRAPSMTLTEADVDGAPTKVRLQKDPSEEKNIISGSIADPNDNWQPKEYPERRDTASIAQVGENSATLDLQFTNDHRIAQRIAKIQILRANAAHVFGANYWLRAIPLQPGDIVTQTYARYAINSETFRVHLWGLEAAQDRDGRRKLTVPMQLVEERQEWFDWDHLTEEKPSQTIARLPTVNRLPKMTNLDGVPTFGGPFPPANPKIGWLWRDETAALIRKITFRWDGSAWVDYATDTKTADQINYLSGADVDSLEPAEAAADVTSLHAINGVDNPGFEAGDVGWFGSSSWSIVLDVANSRVGIFCAQVVNGGNGESFINEQSLQVDPGDRVLAQSFFKVVAGTGGLHITIEWEDESGALITSPDGNVVTSSSYSVSRLVEVAPANAASVTLRLVVSGGANDVDGFADGTFMAIIPRNLDIDALLTTNAPAESGADVTQPRILGNVLVNPSAETGNLDGWNPLAGSWSASASEPRVGDFSLVAAASTGNLQIRNLSQMQVDPGDRVLAQAFVQRTGGAGAEARQVRVRISWLDASGSSIAPTPAGNAVTTLNYAQSRLIDVAPANAVAAAFEVQSPPHSGDPQGILADGCLMGIIPRGADLVQFVEHAVPGPINVSGSGGIQGETVTLVNVTLPGIPGTAKVEAHFTAEAGNVAGSQRSSVGFIPDVSASDTSQQTVFVPGTKAEQSVRGVFTFTGADTNADVSLGWGVISPVGPNDAAYNDIVIIVEIIPG